MRFLVPILVTISGCSGVYLRQQNLEEPSGIVAVRGYGEPTPLEYHLADGLMITTCSQRGFQEFKIAAAGFEARSSTGYWVFPCLGLCVLPLNPEEYRIHFRCIKPKPKTTTEPPDTGNNPK